MYEKYFTLSLNYFRALSTSFENAIDQNLSFLWNPTKYGQFVYNHDKFKNDYDDCKQLWNDNNDDSNLPLIYQAIYYIKSGAKNNVNIY